MRKNMESRKYLLLIVGMLVFCPGAKGNDSAERTFYVQPRVEVGVGYYELQFGSTNLTVPVSSMGSDSLISVGKLEFSGVLPTIGGGVTLFADRFLLDLSAQRAFNGHGRDTARFVSVSSDSRVDAKPEYDGDFDRNEYTLSLGYAVSERFLLFAGYKWVNNSFDDVHAAGPASIQSPEGQLNGTFLSDADFKFRYSGPFIGAGYGWDINETAVEGVLTFRLALGFFDGELDASGGPLLIALDNTTVELGGTADNLSTKGDTTGLTLGLTWVGETPLAGLSYLVNVNGYSYSFDADDSGKADIDETFINLKFGVAYNF